MLAGGRLIVDETPDFYALAVVLLQHHHGHPARPVRGPGAGTRCNSAVPGVPLRTSEYLGGKLLAYLVIGSVVGAGLVAGMVGLLGTPMAGNWWELAVGLVVLLFAPAHPGGCRGLTTVSGEDRERPVCQEQP